MLAVASACMLARALQTNGIMVPEAMTGVEAADLDFGTIKAGTKGLIRNVLKKANGLLATAINEGATPPPGSGDAGAIRALVEAVTRQQVTVKVELGPRIRVSLFALAAW